MHKFTLPTLLLLFLPILITAQPRFRCAAAGRIETNVETMTKEELVKIGVTEDYYYLNILSKKISIELLGLPESQPIKIIPAKNVNNFQAEHDPSAFIIYYNPFWMKNLKQLTGVSDWVSFKPSPKLTSSLMMNFQGKFVNEFNDCDLNFFLDNKYTEVVTGILAHEMGHILSGHPVRTSLTPHERELQADEMSGEILRRLHLSQKEALHWLNVLPSSEDISTHPPKEQREAAILKGWTNTKSNPKIEFRDTEIKIRHNIVDTDGQYGMEFLLNFDAYNLKTIPFNVTMWFYGEDKKPLKDTNGKKRTASGNVSTADNSKNEDVICRPSYSASEYTDIALFIPYNELEIPQTGTYQLYTKVGMSFSWWDHDINISDFYPFSIKFK